MREPIETALLQLFSDVLNIHVPSADTDLFETGILDSQTFVEVVLQLEQKFTTQLVVEDFELDNFRTIANIASLILALAPQPATTSEAEIA